MKQSKFAEDQRPLDASIDHLALQTYSRAYLHHLVRAGEILGMMILSWANIAYYQHLMAGIRDAIETDRFESFRSATKKKWESGAAGQD